MIALNRRTRIYVCKDPTDMRASYDSLFGRVKGILNQDPYSGHLFLFVNRTRTSCKVLYYDGTGFVILQKRLDKGTFSRVNPSYTNEVILTEVQNFLRPEPPDFQGWEPVISNHRSQSIS